MTTLMTTNPWDLMQQWRQEMDRPVHHSLLSDDTANVVGADWCPAVDIKEEKDQYLIHADLPGVEADDIEVTMERGILSIKGERRLEHTEEKGDYRRTERSYGMFHRRFTLPEGSDTDHITANRKDGVLEVTIPKTEIKQPVKIDVSEHH